MTLHDSYKIDLETLIFLCVHISRIMMLSSCTLLVVINEVIWNLCSLTYSYS